MKERLNLYVDEKLIERAKLHAVLQKTSVSEIVEGLLRKHLDGLDKRKGTEKSK
jgi:predicted HicB family RNase H-like nuclease